jgi:two-component system chemotaxis response regulator CheY
MKKVLIADDAQFMRLSLRKILEKNGFEVIAEAADGIEAISKFRTANPDIITMDLTMPEMNGIEAIKQIKKLKKDANIIVISAMGSMSCVYDAVAAGACGFIVKPFKEEDVVKSLSRLL